MSTADAEVVEERPRPWGLWATLGWSLLVQFACFLAQIAVVVTFITVATSLGSPEVGAKKGFLLCVATWISNLICMALVVVLVGGRGWPLADYLALRKVRWLPLAGWIGSVILLVAFWDALAHLVGRRAVSDSMLEIYKTAIWPWLLWLTVLVAAPVFEEVFFRGFMFRGIQSSRLGSAGAILLTSAVWAGLHLQYDWWDRMALLAGGILLGIARVRTGSVFTTIAMHSTMSLVATLEVWWYLNS